MYPDVRFKILADKLLQKYHGNRQLRLDDATCTQVYDSDTPASVSYPQPLLTVHISGELTLHMIKSLSYKKMQD
jgi:hypothetical protein